MPGFGKKGKGKGRKERDPMRVGPIKRGAGSFKRGVLAVAGIGSGSHRVRWGGIQPHRGLS